MVAVIQMWIFVVLSLAILAMGLWAFINAIRFRPDAYVAASKRSKVFWCVLTGVSVLLAFLSLPYPLGRGGGSMLFMIIAVVIAGVFLADVLPALKSVMRRAQGNRW